MANRATPHMFIDTINVGKHIVIFYEEPEYARNLEFRFISNGLLKGIGAIYLSNDDVTFVESEMESYGIDVRAFKKNNLLRILNVADLMSDDGKRIDAQNFWDKITTGFKSPFIVGRVIPDVGTSDWILAELEIEHYLHEKFDGLGCALLCTYNVNKIEDIRRGKWLIELLKTHHGVVFAPQFGRGIGFLR